MKGKDNKVTCYSCGESIDLEFANETEEGYLCDDCFDELEEDYEELEDNEELDFYEEEDELDFEELDEDEDLLDLYYDEEE